MILLIYLKISIVLALIIFCGLNLFRRATEEKRAEVVIPSGIIIGIGIYVFLLNLVAHFLKGPLGLGATLGLDLKARAATTQQAAAACKSGFDLATFTINGVRGNTTGAMADHHKNNNSFFFSQN